MFIGGTIAIAARPDRASGATSRDEKFAISVTAGDWGGKLRRYVASKRHKKRGDVGDNARVNCFVAHDALFQVERATSNCGLIKAITVGGRASSASVGA